jgi:hypothetical protein
MKGGDKMKRVEDEIIACNHYGVRVSPNIPIPGVFINSLCEWLDDEIWEGEDILQDNRVLRKEAKR